MNRPYPKRQPDPGCPVWALAFTDGRKHLEPEDIMGAMAAGVTVEQAIRALLIAIDIKATNDASLSAYVLLRALAGEEP